MIEPPCTEKEFLEKYGVFGQYKGVNFHNYKDTSKRPSREGRGTYYRLLSNINSNYDIDVMNGWVCFRDMYRAEKGSFGTFFFGFPQWMWRHEGAKEYANWVVNESFFADVFITKDVDVWEKYGGFARTDVPRYMTEGAIAFLRLGFDAWSWHWYKFVEMGYDGMTSQILALHASRSVEGCLNLHYINGNHVVVNPWESWMCHNFKIVTHEESSYANLQGKRKSLNNYHFSSGLVHDKPDIKFGETKEVSNGFNTHTLPVFNQENVEILLQQLKSL